IKVYDALTGAERASFYAYAAPYGGGVRGAVADVNGDGYADIITGTTAGTQAHVKGFDGRTLQEISSFFVMPGFTKGIYVAGGDVNGDGHADVIVGSDAVSPSDASALGGRIMVYDGVTGAVIRDFTVFDRSFLGGVRVAAG